MSLIQYRPFRTDFGLPQLSNLMDNFFDNEFFEQSKNAVPAVNIKENEQNFSVEVAAPGLEKDDFKIELNNRTLSISSEKQEQKEEKNDKYTRKEFSFRAFKRNFSLPDSVDTEQISASYNNGILNLILPKRKKDDSSKVINIS